VPEHLTRATAADLEIRSDGRTITGIAMPFDAPAEVSDGGYRYTEVFRRGAFQRTIAERGTVKLLTQHQRQSNPIGRTSVLREDPSGLYMEARVSNTTAGDEVLALVADGALDGLSIGYSAVRDDMADDGTVQRLEVRLREISVVTFPAYADAAISGVRTGDPNTFTFSREAAFRRLQLLERSFGS
jgi:HK97 family phage prohead protease